jgi:hypothetical protein
MIESKRMRLSSPVARNGEEDIVGKARRKEITRKTKT